MMTTLIVAAVLMAGPAELPALSDAEAKVYEEAKSKAQRDPNAHVRLALWCEAHGLDAERLKHLAIALLADPKNATARGLLGLVAFKGQWTKPEAVADKVRGDEEMAAALAEYNEKRAKTPNTADAQWQLALWCEQKGLKAEATAHLTTAVRLEPGREAAWKRLGYKKHNGHWMSDAQVAAEKADIEAQKKADLFWKPRLEKWKGWLGQKEKQAEAEKLLAEVNAPRAVPAILAVFGSGNDQSQLRAVQLLGQIDSPTASRSLAILGVRSPVAEVRRTALETLKNRDARDYLGLWIGLLHKPFKYEVRPVAGPGSTGQLFVEGEAFNVRRLYRAFAVPARLWNDIYQQAAGVFIPTDMGQRDLFGQVFPGQIGETPAGGAGNITRNTGVLNASFRGDGNSNATHAQILAQNKWAAFTFARQMAIEQNLAVLQTAASNTQQQLQNDIATLDSINAEIKQTDERAVSALQAVSGEDYGSDPIPWAKWWSDLRGYAYTAPDQSPNPTFTQLVPMPNANVNLLRLGGHSCFGQGTQVRTREGLAPIESLRAGDVILAQNTRSGELTFQPIIAVYHNAPNATLRIKLGEETIVATGIHRFWKAGKGWVMARELKPGDTLRTLGGVVKVEAVETDAVQPVFNLEVAEGQSFFVGKEGFLVHDNSLVQPELHPFDTTPALAAAKPSGQP